MLLNNAIISEKVLKSDNHQPEFIQDGEVDIIRFKHNSTIVNQLASRFDNQQIIDDSSVFLYELFTDLIDTLKHTKLDIHFNNLVEEMNEDIITIDETINRLSQIMNTLTTGELFHKQESRRFVIRYA